MLFFRQVCLRNYSWKAAFRLIGGQVIDVDLLLSWQKVKFMRKRGKEVVEMKYKIVSDQLHQQL